MNSNQLISPQFRLPRSISLSADEIIATEQATGQQYHLTLPPKPIECYLSGRAGLVSDEYEITATPIGGGVASFPIRSRLSLTVGFQGLFDPNNSNPIANICIDFSQLGSATANVSAPAGFLGTAPPQNLSRVGVQFKGADGVDRGYAVTGSSFIAKFVYAQTAQ